MLGESMTSSQVLRSSTALPAISGFALDSSATVTLAVRDRNDATAWAVRSYPQLGPAFDLPIPPASPSAAASTAAASPTALLSPSAAAEESSRPALDSEGLEQAETLAMTVAVLSPTSDAEQFRADVRCHGAGRRNADSFDKTREGGGGGVRHFFLGNCLWILFFYCHIFRRSCFFVPRTMLSWFCGVCVCACVCVCVCVCA